MIPNDLQAEKVKQAVDILNEEDIDLWLTIVRETAEMADPVFPFVIDSDVVWESAFMIHRSGRTVALVGSIDAASVKDRGLYQEVIGYDEDMGPDFRRVLRQMNPKRIGVNFSKHSNTSDGLTHGLYLTLVEELLKGTNFASALVSADAVVSKLRGRKTKTELARIRRAIAESEDILDKALSGISSGSSEKDVFTAIKSEMYGRGYQDAWSPAGNPGVDIGFGAHRGHGGPQAANVAKPGDILHVDFGARVDGYSADIQRVWVFGSEDQIAPDVQKAFDAVRGAIMTAAEILRPGVVGWQVDDIARSYIVGKGYPEYKHALGHQMGRMAHDGGSLLGPRWPRYGDRPYGIVEEGNVFTLELGIATSKGYIGLEEDVVVTSKGCEFLSTPQEKIRCLPL